MAVQKALQILAASQLGPLRVDQVSTYVVVELSAPQNCEGDNVGVLSLLCLLDLSLLISLELCHQSSSISFPPRPVLKSKCYVLSHIQMQICSFISPVIECQLWVWFCVRRWGTVMSKNRSRDQGPVLLELKDSKGLGTQSIIT